MASSKSVVWKFSKNERKVIDAMRAFELGGFAHEDFEEVGRRACLSVAKVCEIMERLDRRGAITICDHETFAIGKVAALDLAKTSRRGSKA